MNIFDKYVTEELGIKYYGRYVDDFIVIHNDKKFLLSLVEKFKSFLKEKLSLTLHPKKIYIQHFSRGVKFLGAYIKPNVKFIENRTKGNFYSLIYMINRELVNKQSQHEFLLEVRTKVNSYLGIMQHFSSFKLRKKVLSELDALFYHYFMTDKNLTKVVLKVY